jgi:hypothetical protein
MKVRREIASIPVRSAGETWQVILHLITGSGSVDVNTLKAASSVMESLIADEHPAAVPIVVKGHGPRLVIYCLYNEAALEAGKDIDGINWNPTGGSAWKMTAPSEPDDVSWMNGTLKSRAPRITVHDVASPPADDEEDGASTSTSANALHINWGALDRS